MDEFTGRTMPGRRWGDGLHQAIEAKERLPIQNETVTLASISYQVWNVSLCRRPLAECSAVTGAEAERQHGVALPVYQGLLEHDTCDGERFVNLSIPGLALQALDPPHQAAVLVCSRTALTLTGLSSQPASVYTSLSCETLSELVPELPQAGGYDGHCRHGGRRVQ